MYFFGGRRGGGYDAKDSKLRHEKRIMPREYFQPFSSQSFVFPSAGYKPEDQNKEKTVILPAVLYGCVTGLLTLKDEQCTRLSAM